MGQRSETNPAGTGGFETETAPSRRQLYRALEGRRRKQNLGFSSRPFVLCGLPVRKPLQGQMLYERRNGNFVLQITGHPDYGLPFGQGRVVPIYLATLAVRQQSQTIRFRTAAEMLETFGLHKAAKNIAGWWRPSNASSALPSFSEPIHCAERPK